MMSEIIAVIIVVLSIIAAVYVIRYTNKVITKQSKVVGLNVIEKDVDYDNRFFVYKIHEDKSEVLINQNPISESAVEQLFIDWGKGKIK